MLFGKRVEEFSDRKVHAGDRTTSGFAFPAPRGRRCVAVREAIVRAFQGGKEPGGYLASGEELGIELQIFSTAPRMDHSEAQIFDSFCHTLAVVLIDRALLDKGGDSLWDWLSAWLAPYECFERPTRSLGSANGRTCRRSVFPQENRVGNDSASTNLRTWRACDSSCDASATASARMSSSALIGGSYHTSQVCDFD